MVKHAGLFAEEEPFNDQDVRKVKLMLKLAAVLFRFGERGGPERLSKHIYTP